MRGRRAHIAGADDGNFFPCTHDFDPPEAAILAWSRSSFGAQITETGSLLPLCYDLSEAESKGAVLKVSRKAVGRCGLALTNEIANPRDTAKRVCLNWSAAINIRLL